jgi:hypothetical protein
VGDYTDLSRLAAEWLESAWWAEPFGGSTDSNTGLTDLIF